MMKFNTNHQALVEVKAQIQLRYFLDSKMTGIQSIFVVKINLMLIDQIKD